MQEISPQNLELAGFVSLFIMFFVFVTLFMTTTKLLNYIVLRFKIAKIKKLGKKIKLDGYVLKTNQKGIPIFLVSKTNPEDIFLV